MVERGEQLVRRRRACRYVLRQAARDELTQCGRYVSAHRAHQRWRIPEMCGEKRLRRGVVRERMLAREQLPGNDAPRVDVGAMIRVRIAGGLLRRDVGRGAD